jgi:hypothetical protein
MDAKATWRIVAVGASVGLGALWTLLVLGTGPSGAGPTVDPGPGSALLETGPPVWLVWGIFTSLAAAGAATAVRGAPGLTALVGFVSLVPVGLFLLAAPGLLRWIGVLDVILLGAGLVGLRASLRRDPDPPA